MPIQPLDIFTYYNVQRFKQAGSMDCANFYEVDSPDTKTGKNHAVRKNRFNGVPK